MDDGLSSDNEMSASDPDDERGDMPDDDSDPPFDIPTLDHDDDPRDTPWAQDLLANNGRDKYRFMCIGLIKCITPNCSL